VVLTERSILEAQVCTDALNRALRNGEALCGTHTSAAARRSPEVHLHAKCGSNAVRHPAPTTGPSHFAAPGTICGKQEPPALAPALLPACRDDSIVFGAPSAGRTTVRWRLVGHLRRELPATRGHRSST
jgi:hypothetical protein